MSHYNPFTSFQTLGALGMSKLPMLSLNGGFCIWISGIAEKVLKHMCYNKKTPC